MFSFKGCFMNLSRRSAFKSLLGIGLAPMFLPKSVQGANERITVGMIGVGRQAVYANIKQFFEMKDVQIIAVCDVDSWRLDKAKTMVNETYAGIRDYDRYDVCTAYEDYRALLDRDDIDAVMNSTPDHWHVPISIDAIRKGKDVSCEKPLTLSIAEGRLLSDLATKNKRVFRTDSEFRSLQPFHRAVELVRNGRIGTIHTIRTGVPGSDIGCDPQPEMPVPKELNYGLWTGPAAMFPYTEKRVHPPKDYGRPGWMRVRNTCDGMICNWGTHLNDIAQWGNGTDRTGPVEVEGTGEYPKTKGLWNVLVGFDVKYTFANGVNMTYSMGNPFVRFEGDEGWVQVDYNGMKLTASSDSILKSKIKDDEIRFPLKSDKRDFIDAVKTRGQTLEDAEVGHRTNSLCQIAHIAIQIGKKLEWDPEQERFKNSDQANAMLTREMREPWTWDYFTGA